MSFCPRVVIDTNIVISTLIFWGEVIAIEGRADYLVTGDRDLLSLKDEFSCPILTADEFLAIIEAQ